MGHLSQKEYEEALEPLLRELSDAARWIQETGQRLMVIFEGRDTAGKGGSIHMFSSTLNPRQCHVVATGEEEHCRTGVAGYEDLPCLLAPADEIVDIHRPPYLLGPFPWRILAPARQPCLRSIRDCLKCG